MNVKEIEVWLKELCQQLEETCNIYIFAGAALALKNLKSATKDIDLIFENKEDRVAFEKALDARGYKKTYKGHPKSDHTGWSLNASGETHLYCPGPYPFRITPSMRKRSNPRFIFRHVNVFVLAPEDLLLLKTYPRDTNSDEAKHMRPDDVSDIKALLTMDLNWTAIRKEIDAQVRNIIDDPNVIDKRSARRVPNRFHLGLSSLKSESNIPTEVILWAKRRSKSLERKRKSIDR